VSPRIATIGRWLLATVAVALLVSFVDVPTIGARLAGTDLRFAVPAVLGLVVVHAVAATTWRRLLRDLAGVSLDWRATLRLYYAAQVLGTVTPGNLGADVYRVLAVRVEASRGQLVGPVLVQRLTSTIALISLGVAGAMVLPVPGLAPFGLVAAALGGILAITTVAMLRRTDAADGGRLWRIFGWTGATVSRGRLRSAVRDGIGLGLVFHGAGLLLGLVLVRAVDAEAVVQPSLVLAALAVARLSLAVPIAPNGIGIQEGVLAILFVQLGLPAESAIAAALLNRLAFLLTAAVGAISLAVPRGARPAPVPRPSRPPVGG
jgi:uncharacterized membrane protein YbhN (UPF0104 family)